MMSVEDARKAVLRLVSEKDAKKRIILADRILTYIRRREDAYAVLTASYEVIIRALADNGIENVVIDDAPITADLLKDG